MTDNGLDNDVVLICIIVLIGSVVLIGSIVLIGSDRLYFPVFTSD